MAFSYSNNANASGSTFNEVQGNQTTIHRQTINIFVSPGQLPHCLNNVDDIAARPTFSREMTLKPACRFDAHVAAGLIVEIVQALMDPHFPDHCRVLKKELSSLQQVITLAGLAIKTFDCTPLGQSLVDAISREMEECCAVLNALRHTMNNYLQLRKQSTFFGNIKARELEEVASWKMMLSTRQKSLGECLKVLDSPELGNGLRAGHVSFEDFYSLLRQGPPSLHHIKLNHIIVVDHLGRNIPVPTVICSTWMDFHRIVSHFCKGSVGNHLIERGDYKVIRAGDNKDLDRTAFSSAINPGLMLEMSIVLEESTPFQDNKGKCPRCQHVNRTSAVDRGWIECRKCSGQFHVAKSGETTPPVSQQKEHNVGVKSEESLESGDDGRQYYRRINLICKEDSEENLIWKDLALIWNALSDLWE